MEFHSSPFGALSFPDSKRYPFTAGLTKRVFQLSFELPTFCTNNIRLSCVQKYLSLIITNEMCSLYGTPWLSDAKTKTYGMVLYTYVVLKHRSFLLKHYYFLRDTHYVVCQLHFVLYQLCDVMHQLHYVLCKLYYMTCKFFI